MADKQPGAPSVIDPVDSLRHTARRFATGVTVVAARHGGRSHALTANSFVTLSLRPALIGVAVRPDGRMRAVVERCRSFGVSVLNADQRDYAQHYAGRDRFGKTAGLVLSPAGAHPVVPLVPGCVAYFICELQAVHPVGDHDLLVAAVTRCEVLDHGRPPLIFLDGAFHGDVSTPD
jgi:flavin reductase (DIM6/NTAB) family NADH-FMN oxidoreductase RutF